jgi:LacI family transcriptional regulator
MAHPPRVALAFHRVFLREQAFIQGILKYSHAAGGWDIYRLNGLPIIPPEEIGQWRGDGIITGITRKDGVYETIKALGVPAVNVSGVSVDLDLPSVVSDDEAIGRLGAEHFLDRGFRNFGYFGRMKDAWYSVRRAEGFQRTLEREGFSCSIHDAGQPSLTEGILEKDEGASRWLTSLPRPVGILCCDDRFGQHVIGLCLELGISVPDEVAVLGVDNMAVICELTNPALSSVPHGGERSGYEAAALLDRLMAGQEPPREPILVPPQPVVVRRSSDIVAVVDAQVAQAVRFIRAHASDSIYVQDVLKHVGLSRRMLERRFVKSLGRTPAAEIVRAHWERARALLCETSLPVREVARLSGFTSAKHMAAVFRQKHDPSPLEFRRYARV